MKQLHPVAIMAVLNNILPEYEGTNSLVLDLHEIVTFSNWDLKSLLENHAKFMRKMEKTSPLDPSYNVVFQIYYYMSLFDLPSKYPIEEIFSVMESIPEYDFIDKVFFSVVFKKISIEEAEKQFNDKIQSTDLSQSEEIKDGKSVTLIRWCSEASKETIHPSEEVTDYFRKEKISVLLSLKQLDDPRFHLDD